MSSDLTFNISVAAKCERPRFSRMLSTTLCAHANSLRVSHGYPRTYRRTWPTSHRSARTPECLSRQGGQRQHLLTQPRVTSEHEQHLPAPFRSLHSLKTFACLTCPSFAIVAFFFRGGGDWVMTGRFFTTAKSKRKTWTHLEPAGIQALKLLRATPYLKQNGMAAQRRLFFRE